MKLSRLIILLGIALRAYSATCSAEAIAALAIPQMTVKTATAVAATGPNPEYCQVAGAVTTTGERLPTVGLSST